MSAYALYLKKIKTHAMLKMRPISVILIATAVVAGFGASGLFLYELNGKAEVLSNRIVSLENQVATVSQALETSNALSEKSKEQLQNQLQELANRRSVIARSQDELLTTAVTKASPAVVSIVISKDVPLLKVEYVNPFGDDPFFGDFGIRIPTYRKVGTQKQKVGAGTGFLVRSDGYIVSNKHVVSDTAAEYVALLATGEQKAAQVLYRDPQHDLAVLKIDGSGYPSLPLGNSSSLKLGQTVVAIGNALGEYNNSVSVGIVSGLNRTIQAGDDSGRVETLAGVIQTDAAINRGNSGGPLLDLSGNAVGVNVAMEQGANDIGFAIPINDVKPIINSVIP